MVTSRAVKIPASSSDPLRAPSRRSTVVTPFSTWSWTPENWKLSASRFWKTDQAVRWEGGGGILADIEGEAFDFESVKRTPGSGENSGETEIQFETRGGALDEEGSGRSTLNAQISHDHRPEQRRFNCFQLKLESFAPRHPFRPEAQTVRDDDGSQNDNERRCDEQRCRYEN